jgi:hypothetical protein
LKINQNSSTHAMYKMKIQHQWNEVEIQTFIPLLIFMTGRLANKSHTSSTKLNCIINLQVGAIEATNAKETIQKPHTKV